MLHTAGLGFLVGVDIYDCVIVINTQKALDAFSSIRCTLGGEVSAVAGPVGAGGLLETELHKRQAPVFTYLKSRGFYAGIQIDGTVIIERTDENERFYNERIGVKDILAGKIRHPPYEIRRLLETIKAAQGDRDVDETLLPSEPPPGDYEIEDSRTIFGVPDKEDPDPYGVLALEKEGMSIREAGTHKRASWEQFSFQPAPTSPIYSTYSRASLDRDTSKTSKLNTRTSWQTGAPVSPAEFVAVGATSVEKRQVLSRTMTDMSTQTEELPSEPSSSRNSIASRRHSRHSSMNDIRDSSAPASPRPASHKKHSSQSSIGQRPLAHTHRRSPSAPTPPKQPEPIQPEPKPASLKVDDDDDLAEDSFDADGEDTAEDNDVVIIEEPVVHSFQKATTPQFISRARLVEVPKRIAPKLPPRNPNRRGPLVINGESGPNSLAEADAEADAEAGAERYNENGSASSPAQSPTSSTKTATSPLSSRPDWGRSSPFKDELSEKFQEVDISPGEGRNPWGSIMAKHNGSVESLDVPGAFHSLPTTPDEHKA